MVRLIFGLAVGEMHELITQDTGGAGLVRQGPVFQDLRRAIVPQAADVAAVRFHDAVEQRELGVAPIHHVQPVGLERPSQDGQFVVLPSAVGGHVDARGDEAVHDVELAANPISEPPRRLAENPPSPHGERLPAIFAAASVPAVSAVAAVLPS
jgi:hypothetical protein